MKTFKQFINEGKFDNEYPKNIRISETRDNIYITNVKFDDTERLRGDHTKVLNALTLYAEKKGMTIAVTPQNDFSLGKAKAIKLYKELGFKSNKGKNKDFEFMETMLYKPKF